MELQRATTAALRKLEAQGLDAYEVVGLVESSLVVEVHRQMVKSSLRSLNRGIGMRLVKEGRVGFASVTDLSPRAIELAIEQILEGLREALPSGVVDLPPPQGPAASLAEEPGRELRDISDEEKIRLALELESAAIASDSRIARVQNPRYEESVRAWTVLNSKGVSARAWRGLARCSLRAVAVDGAEAQGGFEFAFSPRLEGLDARGTAKRAAERAIQKLGGAPILMRRRPVLFAPRAAAALVKLAAASFFADNVQRGKSALADRLGERCYHPEISLVDDGLLADGFGSFPFDGEGIPRRRTVMARDGVAEGWIYDGPRAARDGVASTGNCRRESLSGLPSVGVGNCFLKGGTKGFEELLRDAAGGVLVADLVGLHTANPITGDFSLGAEGFRIEAGGQGAPVRAVTVSGNVHELLRRVAGVGSEVQFFAEYGAPLLLVEELLIGA